jgi:hypothetical protein
MNKRQMEIRSPRKVPILRTDEEAELFLEKDLSNLDYSQFRPIEFEFLKEV